MSDDYWNSVSEILSPAYSKRASEAAQTIENLYQTLLRHRKIPEKGWRDDLIEHLLSRISLMDSNNFYKKCSMGEREARIASALVQRRHYGMGHGIGRSGDLTEAQPKAVGSSLIYKLTNCLINDLFKMMGITSKIESMVVPVATAMSLVLCFQALRSTRPEAKYIIWSRIDQKACFKSITTAGFVPIIVNTLQVEDNLVTNMPEIEEKLRTYPKDEILCVMSTTSCFAPRSCDDIENIAKLCDTLCVPHVINNAYGLQSVTIMKRIQKAQRIGRVDIFVQSTDKNIMVPVGGAIIATFDSKLLKEISQVYPGRASASPITDAFITLLSLGKQGYLKKVQEREEAFENLKNKLQTLAAKVGERVLKSPENPISLGMTLNKLNREDLNMFGPKLFTRNVSGTRVVTLEEEKVINGITFKGWGSHTDEYSSPYLTCSASIGIGVDDVNQFVKKLERIFSKQEES